MAMATCKVETGAKHGVEVEGISVARFVMEEQMSRVGREIWVRVWEMA